ncbi:virulence factor SrfC family protein [Rhizobium brockwellii]|uniref:virulence factor SrfC family protein n=1 Tax=Rhizobium brockwellii TaxID=3019932 RepID=UPI003F9E027E
MDALDWIREPDNEQTVKPQRDLLSREFRKHVVECRKLEHSVDRPMAIGVFGASQAGKSYLVDRLVSRSGKTSGILFNGITEPLDFIEHINPAGGTESTAIATRFSIQREVTPSGFPVIVRLFSAADLVQIIGDIYYTGFDIKDEQGLSDEAIEAALETALARKGSKPIMQAEDLWAIREFFERKHSDKANMKSLSVHSYWDRAEEIIETTDTAGIVSLFRSVWAGVEVLSTLFERSVNALESLNFTDSIFCPLETLVDTSDGKFVRHPDSIINVSLLQSLLSEKVENVGVVGENGVRSPIGRALLGGLVSELKLTIEPNTWDFLKETDLIDFPGLRPAEVIRDFKSQLADHELFGRVFKDSKVRFLFERYKNERELNGLILCIADSNQDVPALPGLIEEWVTATHGNSPTERKGARVTLLTVLTKFDAELLGKRGENDSPSDRWQARLKSSLLDRLSAQSDWLDSWTPGHAFTNICWFRNPNMRNPGMMEYESSTSNWEVAINRTEAERFDGYRAGYLKAPSVQKYIGEPERAWEEVFRLNDGGLSYIVEKLAAICQKGLRVEQVQARIVERRRMMHNRLETYHVPTDAASRLERSKETAHKIVRAFAECAASGCIGRLMTVLQIHDMDLAGRFAEVARRAAVTRRQFSVADILGEAGFGDRTASSASSGTLADQLAASAIDHWIASMRTAVDDPRFRSYLRMGEIEHGLLVDEFAAASARMNLRETIAGQLRETVDRAAPGHSGLMQAALIAAGSINDFVFQIGFGDVEPAKRPRRAGKGKTGAIFAPSGASGVESLREEPSSGVIQYYADWIIGFGELAQRNAEQLGGAKVNIVQNERLRGILNKLAPAGLP